MNIFEVNNQIMFLKRVRFAVTRRQESITAQHPATGARDSSAGPFDDRTFIPAGSADAAKSIKVRHTIFCAQF